ncbi:hypothetical protein FSP39_003408 [Pinctada imbricata]|uniref:Uncharacterized protein n=1 Tax=Pinctada imbricata TaxID=66713 RepID=A0AA88XEA2_PINIB|nr:hypothetical protein FSP39_003408 [Pinctada imbricata]
MEYTVALVLTIVFIFLSWLWEKTRREKQWPPGPPTIPFVGNLNINMADLLTEFKKLRQQYGDVYSLVLGSQTVIVVNGLDTLKELFIKHGDVVSNRSDSIIISKISEYKGIAGSSGSLWKEHRTFALSTLRDFGFGRRSMEVKIVEEVEAFLASISSTNGQPFNISPLLHTSVSNVVCSVAFGRRFEHDDTHFKELTNAISENLSNSTISGVLTFLPFLRFIPGDPFKYGKVMANVKKVYSYIQRVIDEHKQSFDKDKDEATNYLDVYLKRQQQDNGTESTFTDDQLHRSISDLFVAGTETTSTALRWFTLTVLHKPEIQERMRAEIRKEIGESKLPSMADRSKLPYCDSVIHEVLRFGNIAPLSVPHGLTEDLQFRGFLIPKHAMLMPNLDSVLNDPEIFENPSEFIPTRFLSADGTLTGTEKVHTFGIGRRICLGESLARMELFLFATSMIQRFTLLPADGHSLPSLSKYKLGVTRQPLEFNFIAKQCE